MVRPQYACEAPVRLLFFIAPADPHWVTFCLVAGRAASWKASKLYLRGLCPEIVPSCDLVLIRLRFNSDLSALLHSVSFTMRVMQISSPLALIVLPRVAQTIVEYYTIVTDCSLLLKNVSQIGRDLKPRTM